MQNTSEIELFSTCPPAPAAADADYLKQVIDVARWSERAGCRGILVYSDNSQLDPWLIADLIVEHTATLCPLVAVQPVYMHPYTVAKTVASIACLRGRRVYLNMVAGGFKNDLSALGDDTPHDRRYIRLTEYTAIIQRLLRGDGPVSYAGEFYKVENLGLAPFCPAELLPGVFMSGSSEAGMAAARELGATAIEYPKPVQDYAGRADGGFDSGIRIGIISREQSDAAWVAATHASPRTGKGRSPINSRCGVSDSVWHKQLSGARRTERRDSLLARALRELQDHVPVPRR